MGKIPEHLDFNELILVERHEIQPSHVYTYHAEGLTPGGGLYRMTPGENGPRMHQLVDSSKGVILDCDVSYDGKSVLFSWKRSMDHFFQVYRIGVDGTGLTQLTHDESNNYNACLLPDGDFAFLSDRKPAYAYCWVTTSPILYRSDPEGQKVVRLSANYLNDFTPSIMSDGRVIYSRWEYVDRPAIPIQSLWTVCQDGTGLSAYFGNRTFSPATFMEAREIPGMDGKILCVMTSHNGPCRGAIGIIDPTKGANSQDAIRNLTPEVDIGKVDRGAGNRVRGPYESPYPIDDRYFLVSKRGTVLLRDYDGKESITLIEGQESLGYYSPQPVRSESVPPIHPTRHDADGPETATVFLQDVYVGLQPHVQRGEIKEVAVVQEMEKSVMADRHLRAFGFQFPVVSCGATYAPKKVWGYSPVEEDGSAHFKVPSGVPIYFMALDEHGRALQRMRSFTHFMPGERQSCVGCHSNRNYETPDLSRRPLASEGPPIELAVPEWGDDGFSYPKIVQPVLDQHCIRCHDATNPSGGLDLTGDKTDFFNVSYEHLAREGRPGENPYTKWIPTFNGMEANILEVTPRHWGSPASRLADLILDGHKDETGTPRIDIGPDEQRRIFAWIDLNVPYYGTSESNHYDLEGCRRLLPPRLDEELKRVSARRCASCHENGKIPREQWTRITRPELNSFLLAPLSRDAGGTGTCGDIFKTKEDPDYQAILGTFQTIAETIRKQPRKDMEK